LLAAAVARQDFDWDLIHLLAHHQTLVYCFPVHIYVYNCVKKHGSPQTRRIHELLFIAIHRWVFKWGDCLKATSNYNFTGRISLRFWWNSINQIPKPDACRGEISKIKEDSNLKIGKVPTLAQRQSAHLLRRARCSIARLNCTASASFTR